MVVFYLLLSVVMGGAVTHEGKKFRVVSKVIGVASAYWPGDGMSGDTCADGKPFTKERCHIAHRTWPLGSKVRVCSVSTKKCAFSFVGDRGPFGACDERGMGKGHVCKGKWRVKIHKSDPGVWRGVVDMSKCVSDKIGGKGLRMVIVERLREIPTEVYGSELVL